MNIPIGKTCSRAMDIEDLPTKSVVLTSKITKRMFENPHHIDCLINDLIAKGQSCPTSSDYNRITVDCTVVYSSL